MMLPLLSHAREMGYRAVCANNLRQMNAGWQGYVQEHKETFPASDALPEWMYGGVSFRGPDRIPSLDTTRPINKYLADVRGNTSQDNINEMAKIFRCPGDTGVWARTGSSSGHQLSVLGQNGGETCYSFYGNSYCANSTLLQSSISESDGITRALRLSDIQVDTSRLLIAGDAAWRYATVDGGVEGRVLEASWHRSHDCGHFLAADGSIHFVDFSKGLGNEFAISPKP